MKFVLHHIPKTGGHSIVQSFRAVFGPDAVDVDDGDAHLITTHGPSWRMFEDYPDRAHITILRDPEERIRSFIRYMRMVKDSTVGDDARRLSATEFLRLGKDDIRFAIYDRQVRQLGGRGFDEPAEMMPGNLDRALESLKRMVWVGHTETLTDDLDALFGKLNPGLPPGNVSARPPGVSDEPEGLDELTEWDKRLLSAWARFQ